MKKSLLSTVCALVGVAAIVPSAMATENVKGQPLILRSGSTLLADNVVVTPSPGTQPTGTVQTQAVPQTVVAAPAQPATTVETPRTTKVVHTDVSESPHNYMTTIALSALMGGVVGVLVGGSIYYLGDQDHARNIAYWGAGGILLGVGVGVVQVAVQESRMSNATALNKLPSDPAPTFRLALLRGSF